MFSKSQQQIFLAKAQALTPELKHWIVPADALVIPVRDMDVWQDYRMEKSCLKEFLANNEFASGTSFIVSLPETSVGQLAFSLLTQWIMPILQAGCG